jgi:chromosome segregation protein
LITTSSRLAERFRGELRHPVEEGCQDWVRAILSEDEDNGWAALRKSFVELCEAKIMAGSPPYASDGLLTTLQSVIFKGGRTLTDCQRKKDLFQPDGRGCWRDRLSGAKGCDQHLVY